MTIQELLKNYDFHDSLIEQIEYDASRHQLKFFIDFCFWMQKDYDSSQPETGLITLIFNNVASYDGIQGDIDAFSILDISVIENTSHITIEDDFNRNIYTLTIKSIDVNLM